MASEIPEPDRASEASRGAMALKRWQFVLLTTIGTAALGLVFVTTSLSNSIGAIREEIDARQTFINETMLLSRLNVQLAQVLANLAVATGDDELRQLLADNGITFSVRTERGDASAQIAPGAAATMSGGGERP
jgi:hypothetical protein